MCVAAELGDYDPEEHEDNYVSEFKLLLKQTPEIEEKMMEIHQTQLKGQTPAQVENNFLRKACTLDTYGVDPHPVKVQYEYHGNGGKSHQITVKRSPERFCTFKKSST